LIENINDKSVEDDTLSTNDKKEVKKERRSRKSRSASSTTARGNKNVKKMIE
jgi:hypothetical protein